MILTRSEFDKRLKNNQLQIAFIGMSNVGKTYRATQVAELQSFYLHPVDDEIAAKLELDSVEAIAEWMGQPDSGDYLAKQAQYMQLEEEITRKDVSQNGNTIIDTTGSVVYLSNDARAQIKQQALVVDFHVPDSYIDSMIDDFFTNPKPVVWNTCFQKKTGEATADALRRCYPTLLADRNRRYSEFADIILPGTISRDESISAQSFWKILVAALPE